jgi:hypothetical protein
VLVTEWGDDLLGFTENHSGMPTTAYRYETGGSASTGSSWRIS